MFLLVNKDLNYESLLNKGGVHCPAKTYLKGGAECFRHHLPVYTRAIPLSPKVFVIPRPDRLYVRALFCRRRGPRLGVWVLGRSRDYRR